MNEKEVAKISKFISLVLRHKPETIELYLDENGWANTDELIERINNGGFNISFDILNHVVQTNDKKRFSFNPDKTKIRANQGHSIEVELNLKEAEPPAYLYHGTGEKFVSLILASGLKKMKRQHVHLSQNIETAVRVGQRHGRPTVLIVAAKQMQSDGFTFFLSENNVWLIDNVPVTYLQVLNG